MKKESVKPASKRRTRKVARSAVTGRFVKSTAVKRRPDITVVDEVRLSSSEVPIEVARSATTGRFVKMSTAKRHPTKTIKQRVKR